MTIQEYIDKLYDSSATWFMEEINQGNHCARIANVVANMDYLAGRHKVLGREDSHYKGKVLKTRKTILNYAKTVLRFHDTFLLGKKVGLSSSDAKTVETFNDIYVIYNVSMPVATTEMIANLKALQEMGAISKETIMEKSDIVSDVEVEKSRLGAEYIEDDVVE